MGLHTGYLQMDNKDPKPPKLCTCEPAICSKTSTAREPGGKNAPSQRLLLGTWRKARQRDKLLFAGSRFDSQNPCQASSNINAYPDVLVAASAMLLLLGRASKETPFQCTGMFDAGKRDLNSVLQNIAHRLRSEISCHICYNIYIYIYMFMHK